jgi:hypothetical protein
LRAREEFEHVGLSNDDMQHLLGRANNADSVRDLPNPPASIVDTPMRFSTMCERPAAITETS